MDLDYHPDQFPNLQLKDILTRVGYEISDWDAKDHVLGMIHLLCAEKHASGGKRYIDNLMENYLLTSPVLYLREVYDLKEDLFQR